MKQLPLLIPLLMTLTACQGPITTGPQGSRQEILAETSRQQELVYERMVNDQSRLTRLAYPLQTANVEFCEKTGPASGFAAWNLDSIPSQYRLAAANLYHLDERFTVQSVIAHTPASKAGLKTGDIILSINGQDIPAGKGAVKAADKAFASAGYKQSEIVIQRGGQAQSLVMTPVAGCNYPVVLNHSDNDINAYADGEKIVVSKGIIRFSESDNELSMVIAHELAHSALQHVNKMQQNATMAAFGGLALDSVFAGMGVGTGGQFSSLGQELAVQQYSIPFEQEADYVGMYFMARAGNSINGVADFWRRMGAEGSSSITLRRTHPTSPERFLAIDHTAAEISIKKKRGEPLVPNGIQPH